MKKYLIACCTIIVLYGCKTTKQPSSANLVQEDNSPTLITLGPNKVKTNEFKYVYNKNNGSAQDAYTEKSLRDYLDLYTNFRLKILEAEAGGRDTVKEFKTELEGYRKQLAQPYLTEKGVTEQLVKEAYERMKEEVNASHILLNVSPDAEPKDTLLAYNKLIDLRKRALAGEKFDSLAKKYSEDPSAKQNYGSLGYFTAMQMVYPFEDAAFKTPTGSISMPVRTRFGYHILKVNGRRPSRGEVKVAHIMIRAGEGISKEDSIAAKQKSDEIYNKLKTGDKWNELCDQFSDDFNTKSKGGELQTFASNQLGVPAFEDAAFALAKPGDLTKPVKSPYGYHIIKLIEKQPLKPFSELESGLKAKVQKDSRSDLNKTIFIQKRKAEYKYTENAAVLNSVYAAADSNVANGTFDYKSDNPFLKLTAFTLDGKPYIVQSFYDYVKANQKPKKGATASSVMRTQLKAYAEKSVMDYEETQLSRKHEDYKMLYKEYRDGILLFSLMDEKVWTKAVNDTAGLKTFYEQNKANYQWKKRNDAIVLNAADEATLKKAIATIKSSNIFPVKDPAFDTLSFEKGKSGIAKDMQLTLNRVGNALKRDKNLLVKATAFSDQKDVLGTPRLDSVFDYLKSKGVNMAQVQRDSKLVQDINYFVTKSVKSKKTTAEKKANPLAGKLTFTVYSTTPKAIEKTFNAEKPLTLEVSAGKFQAGENALLDSLEWKTGDVNFKKGNRFIYISSTQLLAPTAKTLDESRGQVISDYQNYLEKEWIKTLRQKYPVVVNEEEFKKIVKK